MQCLCNAKYFIPSDIVALTQQLILPLNRPCIHLMEESPFKSIYSCLSSDNAGTFLNKCEDTHFVHFGVTVLALAQKRVFESAQPCEQNKDMYYVTCSLLKCLKMNNVKYCVCLHYPKCLHCLFVKTSDICDFNQGCICSPAGATFPL